jgi:hypothetical protein
MKIGRLLPRIARTLALSRANMSTRIPIFGIPKLLTEAPGKGKIEHECHEGYKGGKASGNVELDQRIGKIHRRISGVAQQPG